MAQMNYFRIIALGLAWVAGLTVSIFIMAGRLDYWQGWVFAGANIVGFLFAVVLFKDKADVIRERIKPGPGQKPWDRIFLPLFLSAYMGIIVVASLDGGRFGWTGQMGAWVYLVGYVVYLASYFVIFWAMWVNKFFSSVVRIQTERGHRVVTEGPYKYVRHPGYIAGIFLMLSNSLILGSLWGLILAAVSTALIIWRTYMEDKTLQAELAGYSEYASKVKYRLIPGLW